MSDVLGAEDVAKRSSYAARSFEWRRPLVKSEDEFLQRIWNLAEDVSALARSHEQMRGERDAAADDLALVARWLEDEVDAGLQIPLPILAALAFSPAVLYDESRAVSGQTADTGTCGECEGDEGWHAEWCPLVGQTGAVTVLDFDKGEARVEPFSTAGMAATSTGSGAGPSCDGSAECEARTHTHGCFSDDRGFPTATERVAVLARSHEQLRSDLTAWQGRANHAEYQLREAQARVVVASRERDAAAEREQQYHNLWHDETDRAEAAARAGGCAADLAEALRETGWKDADGLCWCLESRELTGEPHRPQCRVARNALEAFDWAVSGQTAEKEEA